MSELKVNSIKGVGASTAAITVNNTDGTCTANITNRTNKNLVVNGAFQIAQRGVSSTSSGFQTVDRFEVEYSGTDEAPTQAQVDVASGTTPYTSGFRKAFKITNGNQTSGAGASDRIRYRYKFEAQDIANSGWNYTSASSFVSLSFWIKSSVAQNFYGAFLTMDGSQQEYSFETGSLSADTWTKVTKTITGNLNLTFNNDNGHGLQFNLFAFLGTSNTGSTTMNQWAAFNNSTRTPDNTSTWYTTNDATLEITGVQLEVGSVATDFEHRSFADELRRCQRYFQQYICYAEYTLGATGNMGLPIVTLATPMRASPTFTSSSESKSSNWTFSSFSIIEPPNGALLGYSYVQLLINTSDSNYGYIRKIGTASAEL